MLFSLEQIVYLFCVHQDMTEIFMDAKSSAAMLKENSAKYML
jgi:hypothetical protein